MKKLSKVLSLVLVFAMVFSLCVIGASANNYEGYTDAKDVDANYAEAVDVLMGIGMVNGRSATQLAPKANYTRAEAAKIDGALNPQRRAHSERGDRAGL